MKVFEHEFWFDEVYPFQQGQGADTWEGNRRASYQLDGKPINDEVHHKLEINANKIEVNGWNYLILRDN